MDAELIELQQAVQRCKEVFVPRDVRVLLQPAQHMGLDETQTALRMSDLARGFILKIYTQVARADDKWSRAEQAIGADLVREFWNRALEGAELKEAWTHLMSESNKLTWDALTAPFTKYPSLQPFRMEVFTVGMLIANVIAKADGLVVPGETDALMGIERELGNALGINHQSADVSSDECSIPVLSSEYILSPLGQPVASEATSLAQALDQLNKLIGLGAVKGQVTELTHFLEMQQKRATAGLPISQHALHMVFSGNPGTGKTTVARILADIFCGLGILTKGHLVETDRAGLVAEYAGQTATKTSRRIEEALDGILFIDEAYGLIDSEADDPYGREAVQTLLKRMEDHRKRLVVILAGYTEPIDQLLKSNPGLTSRIGTNLEFPDYSPTELHAIYIALCEEHRYVLLPDAAIRVLRGLVSLHQKRDEHFGNARLVRNAFERTIRRMATRIVPLVPITHDLLTQIHAVDVYFPDIADKEWSKIGDQALTAKFACPKCQRRISATDTHVLQQKKCPKCETLLALASLTNVVWEVTSKAKKATDASEVG